MNKFKGYFQSRVASQTYWTLMLGFTLFFIACVSILSVYMLYGQHTANRPHVVSDVVKTVFINRMIPHEKFPKVVPAVENRSIRVKVTDQPLPGYKRFDQADFRQLYDYLWKHYQHFSVAVPTVNGQWINMSRGYSWSLWAFAGMISSVVVLIFALMAMCAWAVKRLATPLGLFVNATKRFGVDVDAPPLALQGPPELQEVIVAFNEMQARVKRLLNDRTQMLAAISHDLRTPITRLQLRAEYLEDTNQYDKAIADLNEMENMISSVLSFARDHTQEEAMQRFDLNALLETLCNDMEDLGHDAVYHSDGSRAPYFGRISASRRAFTNLVENAIKYGEKVDVILKKVGDDILEVKISDSGPGIPESQMEKVFSPFYRVDAARSLQKAGAGLGLAVARDVIRAQGGDIQLSNREPRGLMVQVSLPLIKKE